MPDLFFVCGPHCSGKTTVLEALFKNNDIVFRGSEIGKDLYYKRNFNTETQGRDFEIEVAKKELERDKSCLDYDGIVAIETWHPGNLAYAALRNPEALEELIDLTIQSPFIKKAKGICLDIPKKVIMERTLTFRDNREWAGAFYEGINSHIEMCLDKLGLLSKTVHIDGSKPIDEVIEEVRKYILS